MIFVRPISGFVLVVTILAFAHPIPLHAQDALNQTCFSGVYDLMAREERLYRSVLFGQKESKDLPVGSVRYDKESNTWMKVGDDQWRSLGEGDGKSTTWNDDKMDKQADVPARRGILEMKMASTSDILPPLIQSVRALQCRLRSVCMLERASQQKELDPAEPITVQPDGCIPQSFLPLDGCTDVSIATAGSDSCEQAAEALVEREVKLLHLAIAYDAAYRSLMQFAGNLEGFLLDFRFPLLTPIWQAVRALGSLDRIPCFSAQCDE